MTTGSNRDPNLSFETKLRMPTPLKRGDGRQGEQEQRTFQMTASALRPANVDLGDRTPSRLNIRFLGKAAISHDPQNPTSGNLMGASTRA